MKKFLAILLAAMLVISMVACSGDDKKPADTKAEGTEAEGTNAGTEAPATEAPATEAPETEAPKPRDKYIEMEMCDMAAEQSPVQLMGESAVGVHFAFTEGYLESIMVNCPSWSNDIGNITFKVFKWDTDYATTVAAAPVVETTWVDYMDNEYIEWALNSESKGLEAGEYLFWVGGGVDESGSGVGIWAHVPNPEEPAISEIYYNGSVTTGSYAPAGTFTIVVPAE